MALSFGFTDYALLTTTTNPALAAGGGQSIVILTATVCNTDISTHRVTVWRTTGGAPSTQPNLIWDSQPVDSLKTVAIPINGQTLTNGAALYASQDAGSGVNLNIGWAQL